MQGGLSDAIVERREVYFEGAYRETPIYDRARLPLDVEIEGPAIVEEEGSTTVLPPGWRGRVLGLGDLILERR